MGVYLDTQINDIRAAQNLKAEEFRVGYARAEAWAKRGSKASHVAERSHGTCPCHNQTYGHVQRAWAKYGLEAL